MQEEEVLIFYLMSGELNVGVTYSMSLSNAWIIDLGKNAREIDVE